MPILGHKAVEAQVSRSVLEIGKSMEGLPVLNKMIIRTCLYFVYSNLGRPI